VAPVAREIAQQLHGVLATLLLASLSLAALATLTILGLVVAALVAPLPSPDEGPGAGGSAESMG